MSKPLISINIERESLRNRLAMLLVKLEEFDELERNTLLASDELVEAAIDIGQQCDGIRDRVIKLAFEQCSIG